MRYYLLCEGHEVYAPPHILAEVVHESGESVQDRDRSLGSALAGERSKLVTEGELRQSAEGVVALHAWNARDDRVFDAESIRLGSEPNDCAPRLRLVEGGAGR